VINRVSKPLLITKTKNKKTKENIIKNHQKISKIIKKKKKNFLIE
tara:strand:- start:3 stop:137 length:135 start_codon:yes stop_codon:yes gene_type:complete